MVLSVFAAAVCLAHSDSLRPRQEERVSSMDQKTMSRLVDDWTWTYRGGWGASGPSWVVPADVDGVLIFLKGAHPGRPEPSKLLLTANGTVPKGRDPKRTLANVKKAVAPVAVGAYDSHRYYLETVIDLTRGVTLNEVKSRIRAFAGTVRPYVDPIKTARKK